MPDYSEKVLREELEEEARQLKEFIPTLVEKLAIKRVLGVEEEFYSEFWGLHGIVDVLVEF